MNAVKEELRFQKLSKRKKKLKALLRKTRVAVVVKFRLLPETSLIRPVRNQRIQANLRKDRKEVC